MSMDGIINEISVLDIKNKKSKVKKHLQKLTSRYWDYLGRNNKWKFKGESITC